MRVLDWVRRATEPGGASLRIYLGLYMVATGVTRTITGANATPINIFPSRVYGVLLVACGLGVLLTTPARRRCHWQGRIAAMLSSGLYLLLVADAWGAWVSITGALMLALALANEVRASEC